uniref:Uncharacterized protein n=2 Tax=Oryza barthii TaxID=65489 RepID=A0A0D3GP95_9ORYZ
MHLNIVQIDCYMVPMDSNFGASRPTSLTGSAGDPPLGVLSDITNLSAAELRRKRARERYALLSVDEKEARNKKAQSEASHLNITPRRLPFTIINNVAHYGPNEVPLSCVIQTTQNMNSSGFIVDNSRSETHYDPILTSGNQNTHSPMHECGIFEGNDQNDDISLGIQWVTTMGLPLTPSPPRP